MAVVMPPMNASKRQMGCHLRLLHDRGQWTLQSRAPKLVQQGRVLASVTVARSNIRMTLLIPGPCQCLLKPSSLLLTDVGFWPQRQPPAHLCRFVCYAYDATRRKLERVCTHKL